MSIRSVKVCNVSLGVTDHNIKEFFSFSGEIEHIDLQSENERSQIAYVTFKDAQGAETAVLLTGATIVDQPVTIALAPDYKPPASIPPSVSVTTENTTLATDSTVQKAEDVVTTMLAKGFVLGKDALNKAKAFDDKHQFTSAASATAASLDQKIGLSEKLTMGTALVNDKVKEVDQKYQVSEKTKSVYATAEQTVSRTGSALMKNRYVLTGASWVSGAYSKVAKAAEEVSQKTKEKVAEEERGRNLATGNSEVPESGSPGPTAPPSRSG